MQQLIRALALLCAVTMALLVISTLLNDAWVMGVSTVVSDPVLDVKGHRQELAYPFSS